MVQKKSLNQGNKGGASSSKGKAAAKAGSKYSKKEVLELLQIFSEHDKDGGGEVGIQELTASMGGGNLASQAESMFKKLDKDGDGNVTFREYLKLYYPLASSAEFEQMMSWAYPKVERPVTPEKTLSSEQLEEIKQIFVMYDVDGNGVLDRPELVEAMVGVGYDEDEIEDLFEEYDKDGTNAVDFEEFCDMLKSAYL